MTHDRRTNGPKEERLRMCGALVRAGPRPRLAMRKADAHVR